MAEKPYTDAEHQLATVQRVRHVLETEPVIGRNALAYRGLVLAAVMADEAQQMEAAGESDCRTPLTHNWGCGCPTDPPHRGDKVEAWLRTRREEYPHGSPEWHTVDCVLDRYRLHADTGTLLTEHACECRDADDCDCRERT